MKNKHYLQLIEGYTEWLRRLNYSEKSVEERSRQLRIFFEWIENRHIQSLSNCIQKDLEEYNNWLHQRPLKSKTISGYIGALKLCNQYLEHHGEAPILTTKLIIGKDIKESRIILSKSEINQLYETCTSTIWGRRDRAMIAIFYGCGLRSKEGRNVHQSDLNLKSGILHVRKGKGNKERYVPLSNGVQKEQGTSLHGLRHSIATHLLESGMSLAQIGQFLGHSSLESTQIYTRIRDDI